MTASTVWTHPGTPPIPSPQPVHALSWEAKRVPPVSGPFSRRTSGQAEVIGRRVVLVRFVALRWRCRGLYPSREPEVRDPQLAVTQQQYVGRLQITICCPNNIGEREQTQTIAGGPIDQRLQHPRTFVERSRPVSSTFDFGTHTLLACSGSLLTK